MNNKLKSSFRANRMNKKNGGFAVILAATIVISISLIIISSLGMLAINENKIAKNAVKSAQAYYAAESGIQDTLYRIIKNKNYEASNSISVGSGNVEISVTDDNGKKIIRTEGEESNRFRNLEVALNVSADSVSFYYGVQVGEGGLSMSNNSLVTGSVHSNGPVQGGSGAIITGDAWVASSPANVNQESIINDSDFIFGQSGSAIDAAQSFTPSSTERLTRISLNLKKFGSPPNRTIRVLTDNGGKPSRNLVASGASGTLQTGQISQSSFDWINISLSAPPMLQAGTKYWIAIDSSTDSNDYLIWAKDSSDSYAGGEGQYSPNWNASTPQWYSAGGDFGFKAWLGGNFNSLSSVAVGGNAHANTITGCSISGDAYYQSISGSTVLGTQYPGSQDPGVEEMPISDANISDWKSWAQAGGTISENYTITNGAIASLGPKKIDGDLNVSNNADLTITGTVYVTGNIVISNGAKLRLGGNYGSLSGIVLADGSINITNNSVFYGNGAGTYLLFLSNKTGTAITIGNNANTVIFYASKGNVNISNNAVLKEVTGYQITLSNGAQIIYESGLASAKFSSGSGAGWAIESWKEVE